MKTKSKQLNNVKVFAKNRRGVSGFDVMLDFSGQRVFLIHHRHSGLLYLLLEDGMRLDDLRKWKPSKQRNKSRQRSQTKLMNMKNHLVKVIDSYLRENCQDTNKANQKQEQSNDTDNLLIKHKDQKAA